MCVKKLKNSYELEDFIEKPPTNFRAINPIATLNHKVKSRTIITIIIAVDNDIP